MHRERSIREVRLGLLVLEDRVRHQLPEYLADRYRPWDRSNPSVLAGLVVLQNLEGQSHPGVPQVRLGLGDLLARLRPANLELPVVRQGLEDLLVLADR